MSGENVFGPDRDMPPGVYPVPGKLPPQATDFMIESAVMHSKSRGWLPAVVIRIATDDWAGLVCSMETGPHVEKIIADLRLAARRSRADLAVALRNGALG